MFRFSVRAAFALNIPGDYWDKNMMMNCSSPTERVTFRNDAYNEHLILLAQLKHDANDVGEDAEKKQSCTNYKEGRAEKQ